MNDMPVIQDYTPSQNQKSNDLHHYMPHKNKKFKAVILAIGGLVVVNSIFSAFIGTDDNEKSAVAVVEQQPKILTHKEKVAEVNENVSASINSKQKINESRVAVPFLYEENINTLKEHGFSVVSAPEDGYLILWGEDKFTYDKTRGTATRIEDPIVSDEDKESMRKLGREVSVGIGGLAEEGAGWILEAARKGIVVALQLPSETPSSMRP